MFEPLWIVDECMSLYTITGLNVSFGPMQAEAGYSQNSSLSSDFLTVLCEKVSN